MPEKIRVTVWNEGRHENKSAEIARVYPRGIHGALADLFNSQPDMAARTATLDESDHGLSDEVLRSTDVMTWWGHMAHKDVRDDIVEKVQRRVLEGMGLIALHSAHFSKIFQRLMGTTCQLMWREANDRELLWITSPGHPIVRGVTNPLIVPREEMYGEPFDIPEPMETVFISSFTGGEVFRSGVTYRRGAGKVFYFRPGHESYPTFHQKEVQAVLLNAVRWAAPDGALAFGAPNKPAGWFEKK